MIGLGKRWFKGRDRPLGSIIKLGVAARILRYL